MINKVSIILDIVSELTRPDRHLLHRQVRELVDENNRNYGTPYAERFYHQKYSFHSDGWILYDRHQGTQLNPALTTRADKILYHWKVLERDYRDIYRFFLLTTETCTTQEEIRNAFPEVIIQFEPKFQYMARTSPEKPQVGDDLLLVEVHPLIMDKIHAYAAMHLMTP